jgi:hypothetical protein
VKRELDPVEATSDRTPVQFELNPVFVRHPEVMVKGVKLRFGRDAEDAVAIDRHRVQEPAPPIAPGLLEQVREPVRIERVPKAARLHGDVRPAPRVGRQIAPDQRVIPRSAEHGGAQAAEAELLRLDPCATVSIQGVMTGPKTRRTGHAGRISETR